MSFEERKWNLDRVPTKWERIHGSALSILIFLLMGVFLYASFLALMVDGAGNKPWGSIIVAMLLFVASGYLMLRVVFSKRRKPCPRAIVIAGYIIGGMGCALLVMSVLGLGNTPYIASTGLTGLAGSIVIITQGRHRGNS